MAKFQDDIDFYIMILYSRLFFTYIFEDAKLLYLKMSITLEHAFYKNTPHENV